MNRKSIILVVCAVMASMSVTAQIADNPQSPEELKAQVKAQKAKVKADVKAAKAKLKAGLKELKAKQKAELKAYKEKALNPELANQPLSVEKPVLADGGDSIAYLFGTFQSNGLKNYLAVQLHVDTVNSMNDFCRGVLDRIAVDPGDKAAAAYQTGMQIGGQIETMAESLSKDYYAAEPDKHISAYVVANAILGALTGQNEYSIQQAQTLFQEKITARQAENKEKLYGANREAGTKWLTDNATKEGVVTLPSGLQYKVLVKGDGEVPTPTQKVKVNYEGRLIDGTVFDSSYKRNQPSTFGVNQVIKGWTEALCMMPVGSKWEVYIPYSLAYGDRDSGQIKPYSALIFTVELLGIEK